MPVPTYDTWDFRGRRLENTLEPTDFVTSDSTLLLATTSATFDANAIRTAKAIGVAQDMSLTQQRQVIQVFEIGSNQKYTLSSSRTTGQISISRLLFDGRSLLKVLAPVEPATVVNPQDAAGYGDMYTNLASSIFSRPLGMILVFRDMENQNVGGVFFEETFVVSHNMNISSNSPFLGENVSLLYNAAYPLNLGNGLAGTGSTPDGSDDGGAAAAAAAPPPAT